MKEYKSEIKSLLSAYNIQLYSEEKEHFLGYKINEFSKYYLFYLKNEENKNYLYYRIDPIKEKREQLEIKNINDAKDIILNISAPYIKIIKNLDELDYKNFSTNPIDEEYDKYINFGVEIINKILFIIEKNYDYKYKKIFMKKMNIVDSNTYTNERLSVMFNVKPKEIDKIIDEISKKVLGDLNLKRTFIMLSENEYINYLEFGISFPYNTDLFLLVSKILNKDLENKELLKIDQKIKQKFANLLETSIKEEKMFLEHLNYPQNLSKNGLTEFKNFKQERTVQQENNSGEIDGIQYESFLEKQMLEKIRQFEYIKEIKTQSYLINSDGIKYFPDFQLITKNNEIIILEIKPINKMVETYNLLKYKKLKEECLKKGYIYGMMDNNFQTIEELEHRYVNKEQEKIFVKYIEDKNNLSYKDIKKLTKKLKYKDIYTLLYRYRNEIKFTTFTYNKKNTKK